MHLTRRGREGTQGEICTRKFWFTIIGIGSTPPDQVMKTLCSLKYEFIPQTIKINFDDDLVEIRKNTENWDKCFRIFYVEIIDEDGNFVADVEKVE